MLACVDIFRRLSGSTPAGNGGSRGVTRAVGYGVGGVHFASINFVIVARVLCNLREGANHAS